MILAIEDVRRLSRKSREVFLSAVSIHTIKSWNLPLLDSSIINNDVIIITYEKLIDENSIRMQMVNPLLLYNLPSGNDSDEYPVLFVPNDHYLSEYCVKQLMNHDFINRLIEKSEKISTNSTKLMTYRQFKEILQQANEIPIEQELWPKFISDLTEYLKSLQKSYRYLSYLPVSERQLYKKQSVADASFAWGFYIKYFLEEWPRNKGNCALPQLDKRFSYNGWSGDFFARDNPLWREYVRANGKFFFNDSVRDLIYQIWKEWIMRA